MNEIYFNSIKRLYYSARIGAAQVAAAISKGWITEEQAAEIIGD